MLWLDKTPQKKGSPLAQSSLLVCHLADPAKHLHLGGLDIVMPVGPAHCAIVTTKAFV